MKNLCTQSLLIATLYLTLGISNVRSTECAVKFSKVGCFKDFSRRSNLLFSDRDNIDWIGWNGYIDDLVCRCATAAKKNGTTYFSLQFLAECWSDPDMGLHFAMDGSSSDCVGKDYVKPCATDSSTCVGLQNRNYVYVITSIPGEENTSPTPPTESCVDANEKCPWYKTNGYCIKDYPAVLDNCKASCGLC